MSEILETGVVLVFIAVTLGWLLRSMRTHPVSTWSGLRDLHEPPYAGAPLVVLALVAAGDGAQALEPVGAVGTVGTVLGIAAAAVGGRRVFPVLGVAAAAMGLWEIFTGPPARGLVALVLLTPLALGAVLGGRYVPFRDLRPTVLVAKVCAAVVLVGLAVNPPGAGPEFDALWIGGAIAVTALATVLFALPGAGVAVLLGIGLGLLGVYAGQQAGEPSTRFVTSFVVAWLFVGLLRLMVRRRVWVGRMF